MDPALEWKILRITRMFDLIKMDHPELVYSLQEVIHSELVRDHLGVVWRVFTIFGMLDRACPAEKPQCSIPKIVRLYT